MDVTKQSTLCPTPWVLVSPTFHRQAGQARPNAVLADFLLGRGTPVHLVGHEIEPRLREHPLCTVHPVSRPGNLQFLGTFTIRRVGRKVAREVRARHPNARVVVNGGCCTFDDINWVHYVHAAWRSTRRGMPILSRVKDAVARRIFCWQERDSIRRARLVIADSDMTRRHVIEQFRLDPAIVHTVYYGSDPDWRPADASERSAARDWLCIPDGRRLVAFVGGFGYDERKGFDTLWRAWQDLSRDGDWNVDLVAAGDGRTLEPWRRIVQAAGLAERVRLIGFTDRVYDLLAAADLLVSPVRYEPYGLNVQEAICRGVPALVTRQAGVADQFTDDLADMIMPHADDWRDLANRLRRWREAADTWPKRFAPVRENLRRHSWTAMATQFVALAEGFPPVGSHAAAGQQCSEPIPS